MDRDRTVRLVGAPTDYGASRRGVDMGPSAIRYAGLAEEIESTGVGCEDGGDLSPPRAEERDPGTGVPDGWHARFLGAVRTVCTALADEVAETIEAGKFPLVLGGDHSIAIGSVGGSARDADVGVVWFDAHGDFNTPTTTPSGNVHGMPLAAMLGIGEFEGLDWATASGLRPEDVTLVGLRSLDSEERRLIREHDVAAYTMSDIDEHGITDVVEKALTHATAGTEGIHVSFDLDFLDPNEAPGVGTPVRGGATYREAHAALELVAETGDLRSLEFVEVNPVLDRHNETAELTAELAASALGQRIL